MEITTMQQLRNEHRKVTHKKTVRTTSDGKKLKRVEKVSDMSLKAFAEANGVLALIKQAHKEANKPRSQAKKDRTRAATSARKTKKSTAVAKTKEPMTVVKAKR
jgi:hypothetical protein